MAAEDKETKATDYRYCDAWFTDKDGKNSPWKRLNAEDIPRWQQEEALNYNCFATVQRFAHKDRVKGEAFIAPLYFDLDHAGNPSISQAEAIKLVDFFTKELDVKPTDIQVYFSGSKGFHILIHETALGITPRNDLHKTFKHIAGYLRHRLGAEDKPLEAIDLVVYTSSRMLRLPNSIHQKTRLFKVELSLDELQNKTLGEIREMAKEPRKEGPFSIQQRADALGERKAAAHFFKDKQTEHLQAAATSGARYEKEEYHFEKDNPPVCVQNILDGGWKKEGDRNQATVQLASYFKAAGHNQGETTTTLTEWALKHTSANSEYQKQQREANTRSTVEAVYSKENEYRFGCAFIRSLHGEKNAGSKDYDRVPCIGDKCPCLKKNRDDEVAEVLHLAQTGAAALAGKLIKTKVMVAGKKHTPYIVPKKVEYYCWGHKNCKRNYCPLYDISSHTIYRDLGVHDRELIQMVGVGDDNIKAIIKELSGIPDCKRYEIEVVESTNVEELLVIPMADTASTKGVENPEGKYVLRRVYAVGGTRINENKYYEISGYVYPHPKNQESTVIIKDAEPLQDVVEAFKLTSEVKAMLQALKPSDYQGATIEEKLGAVCSDLTYNVTGIVERDEVLLGVLLVMHSVLRIIIPWDKDPIRGWAELMLVGDTATGKSALVRKLLEFVGLGTMVNAESTSRTGLTYKMEQSGSGGAWYIVWGAWPLADKELIWVDEATGIEKDEYGEMTLARSEGKLEVKRAVTAETACRVRAILSGNVPKGRRLGDYGQGVESLKDIFNNEDIRRFDFAAFMRSTDVDAELYNKSLPIYPQSITAETLKNSVLFAWSRKPDEIIFDPDALDTILEVATDLSKVYGAANDIPLVSPADQRNKIARLSTALAALTHSTDESGERIVVYPGHVEFIGMYLKALYNAPGCGLNYYAKLAIKEEELSEERYQKITDELKALDTLKGDVKFFEFIKLFAQQRYLRLGDIEAMLAIEKEEAKEIVTKLVKMRMILNTSGGYRKTPRFNAFVGKCFELGLFDGLDDEY
ncbi:MAG: DNA primase small subunit domain-containing protein [Carboxydocellales bacterium]